MGRKKDAGQAPAETPAAVDGGTETAAGPAVPVQVAVTLGGLGVVDYDVLGQEQRQLGVALTAEELQERGEVLAKLDQAEDEHCARAKNEKDLAKGCAAKAFEVRGEILKRERVTDVECARIGDFNTGSVYVIRIDTGALVEKQRMTDEERQLEFPGVKDAGKKD